MNQRKIKNYRSLTFVMHIFAAWLAKYEIQESGQNLSGQMADKMKQNTDEPQNLYAQSAVLMDADSGRVLFGKERGSHKAYGKHHKDYDLHHSTGAYDR